MHGDSVYDFVISSSVRVDILERLAGTPQPTDQLIDHLDASTSAVYTALADLERQGVVFDGDATGGSQDRVGWWWIRSNDETPPCRRSLMTRNTGRPTELIIFHESFAAACLSWGTMRSFDPNPPTFGHMPESLSTCLRGQRAECFVPVDRLVGIGTHSLSFPRLPSNGWVTLR